MRLVLVSTSPHRKKLLALLAAALECEHTSIKPNYEEPQVTRGNVYALTRELARAKLNSVLPPTGADDDTVYIAADTLAARGRIILGKPADREQARETIRTLHGRTHSVVTGVALATAGKRTVFTCACRVTVRTFSPENLERYLDSEEWRGSSGGYHLHGHFAPYVSKINGQPTTVVGLPIERIHDILAQ